MKRSQPFRHARGAPTPGPYGRPSAPEPTPILCESGAVYIEFLFAFVPLFLLFLAICQLSLIATAQLVVEHAALAGVRSAIVVLEDDPAHFGGAPRGSLSAGSTSGVSQLGAVLAGFGLPLVASERPASNQQGGARMQPIRTAAVLPLLPLSGARGTAASVASSLGSGFKEQLRSRLAYAQAMTDVTVHDQRENDDLASDPVPPDASVTVRVRYLFQCAVPVVRALICVSAESLLHRSSNKNSAPWLDRPLPANPQEGIIEPGARLYALYGQATLPNQGAGYYQR